MSSRILLASLQTRNRDHPAIRFETFDLNDDRSKPTQHGIAGYYRMSGIDNPENAVEYKKAYLKGKRMAQILVDLLNGHDVVRNSYRHPYLSLLSTAIVGGPPSQGHAKNLEGITAFQKMKFQFPHPSTQLLHVSAPTLKVGDSLINRDSSATFDHVEILSGMCLFSMHVLHSSIHSMGGLRVEKLRAAPFTLYEMDYVARASPAIADLTCTVISRCRGSRTTTRVKLDVPSWHYYQSIVQRLESESCTKKEACQWMDAIEARHDQVAAMFKKAVLGELHKRGFGAACDVVVSSRTTTTSVMIRRSMEQGQLPNIKDVLDMLWKEDEEGWREFYSLIVEKERPQDFRALGYLYYVFQVVQPALLKEIYPNKGEFCTQEPRRRRLLISIDDSSERKIYSRSQKLLKKIRQNGEAATIPTLVETYLCKRVFINDNQDGSNLYLDDTTPAPTQVIGQSRESEDQPLLVQSQDIIRSLYGHHTWMGEQKRRSTRLSTVRWKMRGWTT